MAWTGPVRVLRRAAIVVFVGCAVLVGGFLFWWFYGPGISEETAYKLAVEYAETFARRTGLDLNLYTPPTPAAQTVRRLYEYSWTPKLGGTPLTITVDSMTVEVQAIEIPEAARETMTE